MFDILISVSGNFDVGAATSAYIDTLQGPERAQSDAYFEGGYWLTLWGALVALLVDGIFLRFRLTSAFRTKAEVWFKRPFAITWFTALAYTFIGWLLTLPWTIYTDYFREKRYDLLDLSFADWLGEELISLAIGLVVFPLIIAGIYACIRRAPRLWWVWGSAISGLFIAFAMLISPVFIAPLFNDYSEMEAGPLRDKITAMAQNYDIPADRIYVFNQSKQHKRISANVSGIGPTIRISLNDNLLERTSEAEILAVMGHEMGHYKLKHVWLSVTIILALLALGLFLISRIAPWLIGKYGEPWGVRDIGDPASLPVLGILLSVYFLLATPAINTLIRTNESAADAFGLEAARQPDGFATVAMRLSEYRKISPSAWEEFLFFDHPSGHTRVRMAMEWKAQNAHNPQIILPEESLAPKDSSKSEEGAKPNANSELEGSPTNDGSTPED